MREINLRVYEVVLISNDKSTKFDQKYYFGCRFEIGCHSEYHDFLQPDYYYEQNAPKFFKRYS